MTARTRGDIGGKLGEAVRGFRISSASKSVELPGASARAPGLTIDIGIGAARTRDLPMVLRIGDSGQRE